MKDHKHDINQGGYICHHLADTDDNADYDVIRQFTGVGSAYNIICYICFKSTDNFDTILQKATQEQFEWADDEYARR